MQGHGPCGIVSYGVSFRDLYLIYFSPGVILDGVFITGVKMSSCLQTT